MLPNSSHDLHTGRERAAPCPLPGQSVCCLSVCLSCLLSLPRERAGGCAACRGSGPPGMPPGRGRRGPRGGARCRVRYRGAAGSCDRGRRAGGRALAGGSSRLPELQRCPQTPQTRRLSSPAGYRRMGSMGRGVAPPEPPGAARLRLNNRPKEAGLAAGGGGQRVFLVSSKPAAVVDGKAMKADTMLLLLV